MLMNALSFRLLNDPQILLQISHQCFKPTACMQAEVSRIRWEMHPLTFKVSRVGYVHARTSTMPSEWGQCLSEPCSSTIVSFSFKDTPIKMSVEKAQQSISPLANGPSGFAGCRSHSFINVGVVWTSPTISSLAFWIQREDNKKVGGFGVILGLV